jgi:hypothetical protein
VTSRYTRREVFRSGGHFVVICAPCRDTTPVGYDDNAVLPPDEVDALFSRWDATSTEGTIGIMDTLSIDTGKYVVSDLVDIGSLPLVALSSWRSAAIRAAISDAVRGAGAVYVCDQQAYNDWTH